MFSSARSTFTNLFWGTPKPGDDQKPIAEQMSAEEQTAAETFHDIEFVVINDNSKSVINDNSKGVINNNSKGKDTTNYIEDEINSFVMISTAPPTAYSRPLSELSYDASKPLNNSSHDVFIGKYKNETHFIKHIHKPEMTYCESFLGHLYELSLLHGVARAYVRYDELDQPAATSSKGLADFETFKEKPLNRDQLNDPQFRTRFLKILAVLRRMLEDDAHSGNITQKLQLFDADCAFWPATVLIKGNRPKVDGLIRTPATAFNVTEANIVNFPSIPEAMLDASGPWYFPSRQNTVSSYVSTNPWTSEEVALVQELAGDPEALTISFLEYIDWMIDLSKRFPHIAALHIPDKLTGPNIGNKTIIELYCETNKTIDQQYWQVLPKTTQFQHYLSTQKTSILTDILTRTFLRNMRLMNDKTNTHASFASLFDQTITNPDHVIDSFNQLIDATNQYIIICFSTMFQSNVSTSQIKKIDPSEQRDILEKALEEAKRLYELESSHCTHEWSCFLPEESIPKKTKATSFLSQ